MIDIKLSTRAVARTTTVLMLAIIIAVAGIGSGLYIATMKPPALSATKVFTIYLFAVGMDNPYYIGHIHGAQAAAAKYPNLDLVILDGRGDSGTQASQVEEAISRHIDAILLDPNTSDALVPAARDAKRAGIPVFCTDRDISDPSLRIAAVGSDQRHIGQVAGAYALDFLSKSGRPTPWQIVILEGTPGALANTERTAGWYDALNQAIAAGKVNIVADVPASWAREPAVTAMATILAETKKIDLVLASNDEEVAGAIVSIQAAGLTPAKDIYLIGVDASPDGLAMVKAGTEQATVAHEAYLQGYWGVDMAMKYLVNGTTPPPGKWTNNYIITGNFMVVSANVDSTGPFGEPVGNVAQPPLPY